jgi:hypothetical protein
MFQVFQSFQRYVIVVSYGCWKSRSVDVTHVAYVVSVLEACCKCLFKIFHLFSDVCCYRFLSGCCIYVATYVLNVSAVSVLCCR